MNDMTENRMILAIDTKKPRLRIHKHALKQLGSPSYIRLMISTRRRMIIIQKCSRTAPGGYEIPVSFDKKDDAGTFDIYCSELISRIRKEFGGLEKSGLYHLQGATLGGGTPPEDIPGPSESILCFPLSTLKYVEEKHA